MAKPNLFVSFLTLRQTFSQFTETLRGGSQSDVEKLAQLADLDARVRKVRAGLPWRAQQNVIAKATRVIYHNNALITYWNCRRYFPERWRAEDWHRYFREVSDVRRAPLEAAFARQLRDMIRLCLPAQTPLPDSLLSDIEQQLTYLIARTQSEAWRNAVHPLNDIQQYRMRAAAFSALRAALEPYASPTHISNVPGPQQYPLDATTVPFSDWRAERVRWELAPRQRAYLFWSQPLRPSLVEVESRWGFLDIFVSQQLWRDSMMDALLGRLSLREIYLVQTDGSYSLRSALSWLLLDSKRWLPHMTLVELVVVSQGPTFALLSDKQRGSQSFKEYLAHFRSMPRATLLHMLAVAYENEDEETRTPLPLWRRATGTALGQVKTWMAGGITWFRSLSPLWQVFIIDFLILAYNGFQQGFLELLCRRILFPLVGGLGRVYVWVDRTFRQSGWTASFAEFLRDSRFAEYVTTNPVIATGLGLWTQLNAWVTNVIDLVTAPLQLLTGNRSTVAYILRKLWFWVSGAVQKALPLLGVSHNWVRTLGGIVNLFEAMRQGTEAVLSYIVVFRNNWMLLLLLLFIMFLFLLWRTRNWRQALRSSGGIFLALAVTFLASQTGPACAWFLRTVIWALLLWFGGWWNAFLTGSWAMLRYVLGVVRNVVSNTWQWLRDLLKGVDACAQLQECEFAQDLREDVDELQRKVGSLEEEQTKLKDKQATMEGNQVMLQIQFSTSFTQLSKRIEQNERDLRKNQEDLKAELTEGMRRDLEVYGARLREELNALLSQRLRTVHDRRVELEAELDDLTHDYEQLSDKIETMNTDIEVQLTQLAKQYDAKIESLNQNLATISSEQTKLREKLAGKASEFDLIMLEGDLGVLRGRMDTLNREKRQAEWDHMQAMQRVQLQYARLNASVQGLWEQGSIFQSNIVSLQEQTMDLANYALNRTNLQYATNVELFRQLNQQTAQMDAFRSTIDSVLKEANYWSDQLAELQQTHHQDIMDRIDEDIRLHQRLAEYENDLERLREELTRFPTQETLIALKNEIDGHILYLRGRILENRTEQTNVRTNFEGLLNRLANEWNAHLHDEIERATAERDELTARLQRLEKECKKVEQQEANAPDVAKPLERELDSAVNDTKVIQTQVERDLEKAKNEINEATRKINTIETEAVQTKHEVQANIAAIKAWLAYLKDVRKDFLASNDLAKIKDVDKEMREYQIRLHRAEARLGYLQALERTPTSPRKVPEVEQEPDFPAPPPSVPPPKPRTPNVALAQNLLDPNNVVRVPLGDLVTTFPRSDANFPLGAVNQPIMFDSLEPTGAGPVRLKAPLAIHSVTPTSLSQLTPPVRPLPARPVHFDNAEPKAVSQAPPAFPQLLSFTDPQTNEPTEIIVTPSGTIYAPEAVAPHVIESMMKAYGNAQLRGLSNIAFLWSEEPERLFDTPAARDVFVLDPAYLNVSTTTEPKPLPEAGGVAPLVSFGGIFGWFAGFVQSYLPATATATAYGYAPAVLPAVLGPLRVAKP